MSLGLLVVASFYAIPGLKRKGMPNMNDFKDGPLPWVGFFNFSSFIRNFDIFILYKKITHKIKRIKRFFWGKERGHDPPLEQRGFAHESNNVLHKNPFKQYC